MWSLDGRTLGHFRVERLIGRGGMGAVYEAVDEKLERQVALKVLLHEGDSASNRKRFLREARLAAKLTHPNIATVFEVGEFENNLYIVMEMLEGKSLRKLLVDRISLDDALGLGRDIARALARAHAAGVTHRDIKPENVFITTPSPNVLHAKVLDFGLARQKSDTPAQRPPRSQEHTATDATAPGDLVGTPGYWSPEQATGVEVDVRTDVFSFGLVLYEMIAGVRAFKPNATVAQVLAATRQEPEPLRKLVPRIDPAIEAVVARCIAKDPSQRYADGGELLAAMEALVRESGRISQPDLIVPAPPPSRPSLPSLAEAHAVAATPAATIVDAPRRPAASQPERVRLFMAIGAGVAIAGLLLIGVAVALGRGEAPKVQGTTATAVPAPEPPGPAAPVVAPAQAVASASASASATAPLPFAMPAVSMVPTPLAAPATATATGQATSARPRVDRKADCAQPFTVDAKGVKIPKLHCL